MHKRLLCTTLFCAEYCINIFIRDFDDLANMNNPKTMREDLKYIFTRKIIQNHLNKICFNIFLLMYINCNVNKHKHEYLLLFFNIYPVRYLIYKTYKHCKWECFYARTR